MLAYNSEHLGIGLGITLFMKLVKDNRNGDPFRKGLTFRTLDDMHTFVGSIWTPTWRSADLSLFLRVVKFDILMDYNLRNYLAPVDLMKDDIDCGISFIREGKFIKGIIGDKVIISKKVSDIDCPFDMYSFALYVLSEMDFDNYYVNLKACKYVFDDPDNGLVVSCFDSEVL